MTNANILDKAIEAIIVLNAALTNIRLYPPSSAMITNSVDSSISILSTIFEQEDSIVFAESEKNLIIAGQALNEKEQKKPQVQAFTQLMQNLGIKSIAFEKGLEKDEILGFLEVASKKPDDLRKQGGIQSLLSAKGVKNILLDQKLYVAMDKDQRIVSAEDAKDTGQPDSKDDPTAEKDRRASEDRRQKDDLDYLAKGGVERRTQERRKKLLIHIKSSITNLLKGDDKPFFDKQVMQSLAPTVLNMINNGKDTDTEVLTNRLGEGLLNKDEKIRFTAATVLAKIVIKLLSDKRMDDAVKVSKKYIEWIKLETMTPSAYKHVCDQLRLLSQYLILNNRLDEAKEFMSPFYMIHSGKIKKVKPIRELAGTMLGSVGSDKILESLRDGSKASEKETGKQAAEILAMLDSGSAAPGSEPELTKKTVVEKEKKEPEKKEFDEDELSDEMKQVNKHLESGDTETATKLLLDMVVSCAKEKDFEKADSIRNRLIEVNPMALNEIVKSGEIIVEEKSKYIDQEHLDTWAELYKPLSQEETVALFYSMTSAGFDAKQAVVLKQGERNSNLYFVKKGQLRMFFMQDNEEKVIKDLNPGDIFGEDTFFNLTVCTASVTASSGTEVYFLEKDILAEWEEKDLGLESKLRDYTLKLKKTSDLLLEKGLDRRCIKRVKTSSRVSLQSLDASDTPIGEPIAATLEDISRGGVSFTLKITKEKILGLFMEPKVNLKYSINMSDSQKDMDQNGTVVAVINHFYDYSVHVKFDKMLDEKTIEDVIPSSESEYGELELETDS